MKKVSWVLGVIVCCVLYSISVRADVIWEPRDSFYREHSSECTYVNRQFTANGPDGRVILYKSPELPIETDTWENGYQVFISFTYTDSDGIVWGVYDGNPGGWMPMAYMEVVYDSISFREEHSAELLEEESGALDDRYKGQKIKLWRYPGSEWFTEFELTDQDHTPTYHSVYVDERGQSWGYVGYYFGLKNVWVCIDQPTADFAELYPDGVPEAGEKTEDIHSGSQDAGLKDQGRERIVPKMGHGVVRTIVILVVSVVLVTAGLLVVIKRRMK